MNNSETAYFPGGLKPSGPTPQKMADEVAKAKSSAPSGDTIFGKIVRKEIPSEFLYEDEQVIITAGVILDRNF